jgi:long-chain acyl-CoA synthetase
MTGTSAIVNALATVREKTPDKIAAIDYRRQVTFAELDDTSSRIARALYRSGMASGDRVAFFDENSIEYFELLFACAKIGVIALPVHVRLTKREMAALLGEAKPALAIAHADYAELARESLDMAGLAEVNVLRIAGPQDAGSYESWWAAESPWPRDDGSAQQFVALMYTSGSTGRPKGVMLSQRGLIAVLPAEIAWQDQSVNLAALPVCHFSGTSWFLGSLALGATGVILRDADAHRALDTIAALGVTHLNVVPTILMRMLEAQAADPRDVSSLELATCGGAPIPPEYLVRARELFGARIVAFYGLSEAGALSYRIVEPSEGPLASGPRPVGVPFPNVEISVRDLVTGAELGAGEEGEILARTPRRMLGYWQQPEETATVLAPAGWLHTGDVGYLADGWLYITDRAKNVIISGGETFTRRRSS